MSGTVENMLRLARESDAATRAMLARNATTPHEVLAFLAKDEEPRVRASVIANSRAPFSVLQGLTEDENASVREALARRVADMLPSLTSSSHDRLANIVQPILMRLAADAAEQVRFIIADAAKHLSTVPRDAVLRLAMDTEIRVAEPVIRLSPLLNEEDLLALVASPPVTATLHAVARRTGIGKCQCQDSRRQHGRCAEPCPLQSGMVPKPDGAAGVDARYLDTLGQRRGRYTLAAFDAASGCGPGAAVSHSPMRGGSSWLTATQFTRRRGQPTG